MNIFINLFKIKANETEEFLKYASEVPISPSGLTCISNYESIKLMGEGTFGKVFKSIHKPTKEVVAVKQLKHKIDEDHLDILTIREIKVLKLMKHENIVGLLDICYRQKYGSKGYRSDFYLIFEFCDYSLHDWISQVTVNFPETESFMKQSLIGLGYIHSKNYLHRDMKPENILINKSGVVKIADFGWARENEITKAKFTTNVVTLWYRCPEMVLHSTSYNHLVDIWSLGAIFYEMYTKNPLFKSNTDIELYQKIIKYCGEITEKNWPEGYKLKKTRKIADTNKTSILKNHLNYNINSEEIENIIYSMLELNPIKRPDAHQLLETNFFRRIKTKLHSLKIKTNK
uniref:Cdk1-like protein n=1 Tax=Schmidtea mediterranea TaxID=79327 RepID=D2DJT0_SCHMD|nr:cdk1-like protein [Schmidtea mediterranea]